MVRGAKRLILRLFFVGEILLFSFVYFFGAGGLRVSHHLSDEGIALNERISRIEGEISGLEEKVGKFDDYGFHMEQIARENLQMARPNEIVYHRG